MLMLFQEWKQYTVFNMLRALSDVIMCKMIYVSKCDNSSWRKIAEYLFEVHKILCLSIEDGMHLKRQIVIIAMKIYFSKVRYRYSMYTILENDILSKTCILDIEDFQTWIVNVILSYP